jgi:hypothetical protein
VFPISENPQINFFSSRYGLFPTQKPSLAGKKPNFLIGPARDAGKGCRQEMLHCKRISCQQPLPTISSIAGKGCAFAMRRLGKGSGQGMPGKESQSVCNAPARQGMRARDAGQGLLHCKRIPISSRASNAPLQTKG